MANRPPSCTMVYWRFKKNTPCPWVLGYVTYVQGHDLVRMGAYNGDNTHGNVVSSSEIEWKAFTR